MITIREAIKNGARTIYLNNGISIDFPDVHLRKDVAISPPKIIQGKPVFRWLFFCVYGIENNNTVNLSAIKHRSLYNEKLEYCYFHPHEYIAKEKEVNRLISDNGGICYYL